MPAIAAVLLLGIPGVATARRTATKQESAAMWRVVERGAIAERPCVHKHPRGVISTVPSKRWRYGMVTIGDCANGSIILRRRKTGGPWRIRLSGSDIGSSTPCTYEARRVPLRVLRDLFAYPALCR